MEKKNDYIEIKGAKAHNLKDASLSIPRGRFVVITGLSGSGKSSLAFDTIYAEGQRRYMDTLSTYAKHFMGILEKPDVESITGLSPIIAIEQKTTGNNPRSTVGTITEIYDFLRLLYGLLDLFTVFDFGDRSFLFFHANPSHFFIWFGMIYILIIYFKARRG